MTLAEMLAAYQAQRQAAITKRDAARADIAAIGQAAKNEGRSALTADEDAKVTELFKARDAASAEVEALDAKVASTERAIKDEDALGEAQQRTDPTGAKVPAARTRPVSETYRKDGQRSYFKDLHMARNKNDRGAIDRLAEHDRACADDAEYRALTTVDGAGGDFVPPKWMVEQFINLARPGRIIADQVQGATLPTGTDSISLPRLATGTAVAEQSTQNTAVQNTDATTSAVTANVTTIAGQQVVSQQLLDQSPINMDNVLLGDLAADYAIKADLFVIQNNATNKVGLLSVAGINSVSYTDASPTPAELYPKVADAIQQIHTGRYMPGDKIFMHPRRWAWFMGAVDGQGRPLITPDSMNSMASSTGVISEGRVGVLQGLPVYVDPNIPVNLGAGTNEDRIIILRSSDTIFFESTPKSETFRETYANQLSVLFRFHSYVALHASRLPKSISVISGTGLATPTF